MHIKSIENRAHKCDVIIYEKLIETPASITTLTNTEILCLVSRRNPHELNEIKHVHHVKQLSKG